MLFVIWNLSFANTNRNRYGNKKDCEKIRLPCAHCAFPSVGGEPMRLHFCAEKYEKIVFLPKNK
jgi:hypothetical protein